jgi:hypothetical protein
MLLLLHLLDLGGALLTLRSKPGGDEAAGASNVGEN